MECRTVPKSLVNLSLVGLSANRWEARIHHRYRAAGSDSAAAAVAMGYRAELLIEIPDMALC